ncbi:MAG: hypothetical protein LBU48_02475, partial [Coriobacteriales bacterium]|nr:hypothetical protein [Coriobacteriales bacterium]
MRCKKTIRRTAISKVSQQEAPVSAKKTGGFELPSALRPFRFSYLGIWAPHVWIFCALSRRDLAYGALSPVFVLYLALSLLLFVVVVTAIRRPPSPTHGWQIANGFNVLGMGVASVFLCLPLPFTGTATTIAGALLGGFGMAWLYVQWGLFYAKLDVKSALVCVFAAMMLGSLVKIGIDVLPPLGATLCLMALPLLSALFVQRARKQQPLALPVNAYYSWEPIRSLWKL